MMTTHVQDVTEDVPFPLKRGRLFVNTTKPLLYPKAHNPTPYKDKPLCPDTRSHAGVWSFRTYNPEPANSTFATNIPYWEPDQCQYHPFTRTEVGQCLLDRHIIVSGDSLLRNILTTILRHIIPTFDWGDGLMQKDQREIIHLLNYETNEFMGHVAFHFLWTPSVWSFGPKWIERGGADVSWLRPKGSSDEPVIKGNWPGDERASMLAPTDDGQTDHNSSQSTSEFDQFPIFDTIALSMGIWDMSFFNLGLNPFHFRLTGALHDTVANLHFKSTPTTWPRAKVYFADLHKLHSDLCTNDVFTNCNTDVRQFWWREAQRKSRVCLPHCFGSTDHIEVLDNYDMTNTEYARTQTPDGIHYEQPVNFLQSMVWLNGLCHDWLRDKSGLYEERKGPIQVELDAKDSCLGMEADEFAVMGRCPKMSI
ncbi:hypothetical protein BC938DRAFT_480047 [Jimgerdemannia flammicorona]|uniref:Uncharacterized protein n=1 Tax=Jimgerdemannia flammicorona TaxID=994334 RepID=A0A433QXS4_9FUNG|nr:hypothetical protein BC938DRAFT_480047 [Jimgerdemannia flammicorona]